MCDRKTIAAAGVKKNSGKTKAASKPTARRRVGAKKAGSTQPVTAEPKQKSPTKPRPRKPAPTTAKTTIGPTRIDLKSHPGIAETEALHSVLAGVLDERRDVIFDGSKIDNIDTAMLQLLTAFTTQAHKDRLDVRWESPSEPLLAAAKLLDLDRLLGFL